MISIAKRHLEERGTDIKRYGDIRARLDKDKDVWIITFSRQSADRVEQYLSMSAIRHTL